MIGYRKINYVKHCKNSFYARKLCSTGLHITHKYTHHIGSLQKRSSTIIHARKLPFCNCLAGRQVVVAAIALVVYCTILCTLPPSQRGKYLLSFLFF